MATSVYKRRKLMSDINVVPYIDVMLVLLVIFMITAPLLSQGIEVNLPEASAEPLPAEQSEPIVVTVDSGGKYYLNIGAEPDQSIDVKTLQSTVNKALTSKPDIPVIVKGDQAVAYGVVVAAMSILQQAGAPKIGLMTEPMSAAGDK